MCNNYFLATDTEDWFMNLAFAATMIRLSHAPDSIVAQKDSASAFAHGLDPYATYTDSLFRLDATVLRAPIDSGGTTLHT